MPRLTTSRKLFINGFSEECG